jgi:RNA polymerase sigma-70 factor, ECF subfamily
MGGSLQTEIAREHPLNQFASPLTTTSEAQLVISARNGEQLAYAELCRRHHKKILRIVLRITRNLDDAEDVLQDSWMRAFIHIGTFDGRSAFSTWLTRIAINSALMTLRRRRRQNELSLDDPVDPGRPGPTEMLEPSRNPEERCLEAERLELVRQAIMRLPSKLRSAVEIRQSQDGTVGELAMLTGVSLPTMKSRLMRARCKLREPLSKVMKGIPAPSASHRPKGTNAMRKTSRLQSRADKTAVVRDDPSSKTCSVHLNGRRNEGHNGHWMICQGGASESFRDAGSSDGQ